MDVQGRTAIVTGTSGGIGSAIAEAFLAAGARVLGVDKAAAPPATSRGPLYCGLELDLTEPDAAVRIIEECEDRLGPPDILINNAGIGDARPILETTDADFERYLTVNLKVPFALCREVIRRMIPRGGGAIVNISSSYAIIGATSSAGYTPTKGGVAALTRYLAPEHGRDGIRTNAVAPGTVATPLNAKRREDAHYQRMWFETCPIGRAAEPSEIAEAVLYLASDRASYINGVVLPVDGGWMSTKVMPRPVEAQ